MMNDIALNDLQKVEVDGQELFLLSNAQLALVAKQFTVDGKQISGSDLALRYLAIVQANDEIVFSLFLYKARNRWWGSHLLDLGNRFQRIFFERLRCECGWQGITANPSVGDLYLLVKDWRGAMEQADSIPILPCPQCSRAFVRPVIWLTQIN